FVSIDLLICSFNHSCWLVFEPGLTRRNLSRLSRANPIKVLLTLPALPRELVVVPHTNKRPAGARILQVRVEQIAAIQRAVVFDRSRYVKVADLFAVGVADDVSKPASVHSTGSVLRIPDDLVDKVAEVQHKRKLFGLRSSLVLPDHSPIGVLGTLLN